MFTRLVECNVKPGSIEKLTQAIRNDIAPILKKQPGFVDLTVLVSDTDPNHCSSLSFWKTKEDAEKYNREQFPNIVKTIQPHLVTTPTVHTFNVDTSVTHKIAAGKAA